MAKKKNQAEKVAPVKDTRKKVYPEYKTLTYKGSDALTAEQAKELLGYQTETEDVPFGSDYILIIDGDKVRCVHNNNNRPFDEKWARKLAQDMLHKKWKLNGQSIGLSEYGNVVTGQHRLIALVMAQDERTTNPNTWDPIWGEGEPVSIETDVTFGVSEDADVTRTIDNTKARTLSDCFYVDQSFFIKDDRQTREKLCKFLEFCVRNLWNRTMTGKERKKSFAPYLTHSEAMGFAKNHPHAEEATSLVFKMDQKQDDEGEPIRNLKQITGLTYGELAALLYLMGSSASDGDVYRNMEVQSEKEVSWEVWDKAVAFFQAIADADEDVQPIRDAFAVMKGKNADINLSKAEKFACLINAWLKYKDDEDLIVGEIVPAYADESKRSLEDTATVGGIESLEDDEDDTESEGSGETSENEDDPEAIADRAAMEREAAQEATLDKNKGRSRADLIKERHQARMAEKETPEGASSTQEGNGSDGATDTPPPVKKPSKKPLAPAK